MNRNDFAKSLHELAYFLDAHDELGEHIYSTVNVHVFGEADQLPTMARALAPCDKEYSENELELTRSFGESVHLSFIGSREGVCKARIIGRKTERRKVMVTAPVYEEQDIEVDVIEWECEPLLSLAQNA